MKQYLEALEYILENGADCDDRTGVGTKSVFGYQMRFNLQDGFPAVTTKKLAWKSVVSELLWFLEGSTDERRLAEILFEDEVTNLTDRTTIWTANADKQGVSLGFMNNNYIKELGPVYGHQWRTFNKSFKGMGNLYGVDQIARLVKDINSDPDSRRLIVTAWNPVQLDNMALPPCHLLVQFRVIKNKLSCQLYQRSADMFLGVPFNIASYALLTHMIAEVCDLAVGEFIWTGGDCHIYNNHIEQVKQQIARTPSTLPTLVMPEITDLSIENVKSLKTSDFTLEHYNPQASIKAPMAV